MFKQNKQAFTLIELLVVVLIIGILAAVALPQYQKAVIKSRYMELEFLGRTLNKSIQLYFLANGTYPQTLEDLDIGLDSSTLSGDKTSYNFGAQKRCTLYDRNHGSEIWCYHKGIYFMMNYRTQQAWCRTYISSMVDICKSVTGSTSSCVPSNGSYCNYWY